MKMKRILSIILSILLIGTVLVLPLSADALGSSGTADLSSGVTWVNGAIVTTDDATYGYSFATSTRGIRTNFIHISRYSKITWSQKGCNIGCFIFYYETNTDTSNSISAPNDRRSTWVPANGSVTVTLPEKAKYIRAQIWNADGTIAVSDAPTVTLTAQRDVSTAQIDNAKKGTVTIHKYEMNDISTANSQGTGYVGDKDNVPTGAIPLNGVTFKLTKIAEVSSTYYKKDGVALPKVSQAQSLATSNPIATYTQTTQTKTIDSVSQDGIAQFTNLPLGVYLVQEQSGPSQITKKADDFVISIPYTASDRASWKYTVDVYPKNETKYANVRIKKVDKSNTSRGLANARFNVWQSPDNSTWTQVSSVVTNSSGIVDVTNLPTNHYYRLGETGAPAGYINDNANSNNQTYFFLDTDGKVLSRDKSTTISTPSGTTPAIITITNAKPSIQKYIDASRGNGSELYMVDSIKRYNDDNNYQYYMVKVTPPNIDSSLSTLKTFKVTDSFMNINGSKMAPTIHKITCGTDAIQANRNVLSADAYTYTCTQNSTTNTTYDTTLTFDTSKFTKGMNYYIYYKCFVTIAGTNNAKLVYSTQTLPESTATSTITSNTVRFIVGSYQLLKTNNQDAPLQGAEFQLFTSREDALACKNPVYASTSSGGATQTTTFTSNSSGKVYIWDINVGNSTSSTSNDYYPSKTYWLVETKAPTGYNLLAEPVEITVTRGGANSLGVTIVNSAMYTFPLTGSAGILICIVCGVLMIGVAVVVLLVKKKRSKSKVGGN